LHSMTALAKVLPLPLSAGAVCSSEQSAQAVLV